MSALVVSSKWTFKTAGTESTLKWSTQGGPKLWKKLIKKYKHTKKREEENSHSTDFIFHYSPFLYFLTQFSYSVRCLFQLQVQKRHSTCASQTSWNWQTAAIRQECLKRKIYFENFFYAVYIKSMFMPWHSPIIHIMLLPTTEDTELSVILKWLTKK